MTVKKIALVLIFCIVACCSFATSYQVDKTDGYWQKLTFTNVDLSAYTGQTVNLTIPANSNLSTNDQPNLANIKGSGTQYTCTINATKETNASVVVNIEGKGTGKLTLSINSGPINTGSATLTSSSTGSPQFNVSIDQIPYNNKSIGAHISGVKSGTASVSLSLTTASKSEYTILSYPNSINIFPSKNTSLPITFKKNSQPPPKGQTVVDVSGAFSGFDNTLCFGDQYDNIISKKAIVNGQKYTVTVPQNTYSISIDNFMGEIYFISEGLKESYTFNLLPSRTDSYISNVLNLKNIFLSNMMVPAKFGETENPEVSLFILVDFSCAWSYTIVKDLLTNNFEYNIKETPQVNLNSNTFFNTMKNNNVEVNIVNACYFNNAPGSLYAAQVGLQVYKQSLALYYKYIIDLFKQDATKAGEAAVTVKVVQDFIKNNNVKNTEGIKVIQGKAQNDSDCPIINERISVLNYIYSWSGGPDFVVMPSDPAKCTKSNVSGNLKNGATTMQNIIDAVNKAKQ